MKLLEKILVAVDVNKDVTDQIDVAINIARTYNSQIIIVYVIPKEVLHPDISDIVIKAVKKSLLDVKETLENAGVDVVDPIIENGKPGERLLQVSADHNVNLILVGSGGSSNNNFKLGITAHKLIQLSDKPVWIVKAGGETKFSNILCPVDFSDPSRRALKNAILLTKKFRAMLRILNVYKPFTNITPRIQVDMEKENADLLLQQEYYMDEFLKEFDLSDIAFKVDVKPGSVHEIILQTIKKQGHDLLVMGTNGRSGFNRFMMGSVTERVVREMPCSFVTTKTHDMFQLKFDTEIKEIEVHLQNARVLLQKGLYKEAIGQYQMCLQINDMHIPSMYKLANIYRKIGEEKRAIHYDNMGKDLLSKLWDEKIEIEIRNHYKSGI
ncbi:Nucleotide-binding universal stress protein, UspA family [Saccharicrinis carchari]|uniref:Nucleotide-binding universal stress protein, UspA family n=1 Tax=Saccharicrinis carchari TaxID=1168039 RepID=A0A521EPM0_SACCC|nr:universal stress protein [Saccharicrinis carchari]SMO85866.1 Nucleotide-binding universal stress protein, UspA family [Saccharicrinis carchari]